MSCSNFAGSLFRKKAFTGDAHLNSDLNRCLGVMDVMFLAVGQMVGVGIYVLTGTVVHNIAGPSIMVSFIFAAFAALLSAFSYAEFGARFPRAGSAYTYTYVGLGELWAFVIGWTVILEYMIGNAAVARSWSSYFDHLIGNKVANFTMEHVGQISDGTGFFSKYPDVLSFVLICLTALAVGAGSKTSANFNTTFVILNIAVIFFVIVNGFMHADFNLWVGSDKQGNSKFFPFGFGGTLAGAATCFFAFIGFECLATAGEEAKAPQRTIPLATFGSLAIVTTLYVLMSASLTLMVPYDQIVPEAAYSTAFELHGATVAKYVMSIGALVAILNNLLTGVFALPRAVYAMANDGLLFAFLAKVNKFTKVPLNSIVTFTLINALIALIFDLEALVEFLSIGTLTAYSIVSACVLILRYQPAQIEENTKQVDDGGALSSWIPFSPFLSTFSPGITISFGVISIVSGFFWLAINVKTGFYSTEAGCISTGASVLLILLSFIFILGHKENSLKLSFKVPLLPYIPCLSLLINTFMMVYLNALTWIRLFVWMFIGLLIYFGYGYSHSRESKRMRHVADSTST